MSTDADEKVQSKFPRASLRARNKTLMITPADIADFQSKSERGGSALDHLDDVFGDSLGAEDDTGEKIQEDNQSTRSGAAALGVSEDSVEALGDVWPSDVDDSETEPLCAGGSDDKQGLTEVDDIFAAPAEVSPAAEELFSGLPTEPREVDSEPSVRESLTTGTPLGGDNRFSHMSAESGPGVLGEGRGAYTYSGFGATALQSAAQKVEKIPEKGGASHMETEYIEWKKPSKLIGFLVSYASEPTGRYVELREGRLLVTSEASSSDNCLVIAHESVSPMHAIMRISADGAVLILDQLSEHGTRIRRSDDGKEESLMGDKSTLFHGDVVIFGECEYHVVVMGAAALKRN